MGTKNGTIGAKTGENDPNVPKRGTIGTRRVVKCGYPARFWTGRGIYWIGWEDFKEEVGEFWVGEGLFFQKI